MPALLLDPAALPPEERKELDLLLAAPRILAETESPLAIVWILLATLGAVALGFLFFWQRLGVVTSPWASHSVWIAIPYALATATVAIGTFKAVVAIRMARLPWQAGRYLVAQGFLDTRRRPLRFLPITDFTRVEIHESESHTTELRLFTMSVHFGDVVEKFHTFGLPQNIPRAALDELSAQRDAALDTQRSEAGYRFSRRAVAAAAGSPAPSRLRLADHPWKAAGVVGVLAMAPLYLAVLPTLSLRAAEQEGTVRALRAAEQAYPYGWVRARVRPAIHARFEDARARVQRGIAVEHRAPLLRLLTYLEDHNRGVARVRLVVPDSTQLIAATRALEAAIKDTPGATAAPVMLSYQAVSIAGIFVGQEELMRGLASGLLPFIPEDVLDFEQVLPSFDAAPPDPQEPVIEIASSIELVSVFQGQSSRRFAALAFTYEPTLLLPGEPKALFAPKVTVPPPSNLFINRFTFGDAKPTSLGGSGDSLTDHQDDSSVYTQQATTAGTAGGKLLVSGLLAP
jgi:hypothetical protein